MRVTIEKEVTINSGRFSRTFTLRADGDQLGVVYRKRPTWFVKWTNGDDLYDLLSWEQQAEIREELAREYEKKVGVA